MQRLLRYFLWCGAFAAAFAAATAAAVDPLGEYSEKLDVAVLRDGSVAFRAVYSILQRVEHNCTQSSAGYSMCTTSAGRLPASHVSMFVDNKLHNYELHLTRGGWKELKWGPSYFASSPAGGSLAAALHPSSDVHDFVVVRNAIGASFCTSLAASSVMTKPYIDEYIKLSATSRSARHFAQFFPGETLCTENVVPVKHLMQNAEKGLGRLLDADLLLNTPWHSISFSMSDTTADREDSQKSCTAESSQRDFMAQAEIQFVVPPRAVKLFDRLSAVLQDVPAFSLWVASGPDRVGASAVAAKLSSSSTFEVMQSEEANDFGLRTCARLSVRAANRGGSSSSSSSSPGKQFVTQLSSLFGLLQSTDGVTLATRLYDSRARELKSVVELSNRSPCDVTAKVQLPSTPFFQPLAHTIKVDGGHYLLDSATATIVPPDERGDTQTFGFVGGSVHIPAGGQVQISCTAHKKLLHFESYPADASRGFDIPPTILQLNLSCPEAILSTEQRASFSTRTLFGEVALTVLPIPDASMPFNVTTLVSTVIAFSIGSMINALVRRADKKDNSRKTTLRDRIRALFKRKTD